MNKSFITVLAGLATVWMVGLIWHSVSFAMAVAEVPAADPVIHDQVLPDPKPTPIKATPVPTAAPVKASHTPKPTVDPWADGGTECEAFKKESLEESGVTVLSCDPLRVILP